MNCPACGTPGQNAQFCQQCGAALVAAAPATPSWAAPGAGTPPPPPPYVPQAPAAPFTAAAGPEVAVVPGGPSSGKQGTTRKVALIGGVVALLAVGGIAIKSVTSDSTSGGASSPEAAMTAMLDAASNEDPLAMLDVLDPAEVSLIGDAVTSVRDALIGKDTSSQLGKVIQDRDAGTLDPNDLIPGFELNFSDVQTSTEQLGSNYAKVSLNQLNASWTFDAAKFQQTVDVQKLFDTDSADVHDESGTFTQTEIATALYGEYSEVTTPFFVTKRVDGNWYISLALTALETNREVDHLRPAEWGDLGSMKNFGADSPQAAVEQMVTAVARQDSVAVVELLPPTRYDSLYRFRHVIESDPSNGVDMSIDIVDNKVVSDSRGTVLPLQGSQLSFTSERGDDGSYETITVTFDSDCATLSTDSYDAYYDEHYTDDGSACWSDLGQLADALDEEGIDSSWLADVHHEGGFWINVEQEGGRWFVDPIETARAYAAIFTDAAK